MRSAHRYPFGVDNAVFLRRNGDSAIILKQYTKLTYPRVKLIAQLLSALQEAGFPVPHVVGLWRVEQTAWMALKFIAGGHIDSPGTKRLRHLGTVLAQIHGFKVPPDLRAPSALSDWSWTRILNEPRVAPEIATLVERALRDAKPFLATASSEGFVHGDFSPTNVLFVGRAVTGLLDFDHAGIGSPTLDLARALLLFCADKNGEVIPARESAFLDGYRLIRTVSPDEMRCIPFLRAMCMARILLESHYYVDVVRLIPSHVLSRSPLVSVASLFTRLHTMMTSLRVTH